MNPSIFPPKARDAVRAAAPLYAGAKMLQLLHKIHWPAIERIRARRVLVLRLIDAIDAFAEGGKVCAIESGRDCDGVQYDGRVHTIDASIKAWRELEDRIGQWADGPFRLSVAAPSTAALVRYSSRDLVMEAFEDGHPHVIHSTFA